MEIKNLFVTGCYRSGTTLLEKLLHSHSKICLGSQPFPPLYFMAKEAFYKEMKLIRRYPLDHLFLEDGYKPEEFYSFLDKFIFSKNDLTKFFNQMEKYNLGLWTPEIVQFKGKVNPGKFLEIYQQLNNILPEIFPKNGFEYLGGKEVLCEEFAPYFLKKGVKVLIVIRDPRDMITSLNFRDRDNLTGDNRPILYSLRVWRKSLAITLALEGHPNFHWLLYEDLVANPIQNLNQISSFLQIDSYKSEDFTQGIFDQWGNLWKGNSSFNDQIGISQESVGQYRKKLPNETTNYIETICFPEMNVLNYKFHQVQRFDPEIIQTYHEPFTIRHLKFEPDYSFSKNHIEEEIERFNKISKPNRTLDPAEAKKWFLSYSAYHILQKTVNS